jgi:hypothetical protein
MLLSLPITLVVLAGAVDPLPDIPELVAKLHGPRKGIASYELIIDARMAEGDSRPHLHHIWLDGDRHRADRLDEFTDRGSSRRTIDCTNCPDPGKFFAVRYDPVFDPSKAATLGPLANRASRAGDLRFRIEDLGATDEPVVNLVHRGIEWYVGQAEWTEKRVERVRWKDLPAYKIVLAAPNHALKGRFEVTLVPDRGFAAVHAQSSWDLQGKQVVTATESELVQVDGIWLPTTCVYSKHTDGKLTAGLKQKIEFVSLRKPIDPKAFSLQGMGLLPGTLVVMENGTVNWDGTQLGTATQLRLLPPQANELTAEQRRSGSRRLLLYGLAGAAVLASGFFITRLIAFLRSGRRPILPAAVPDTTAAPPVARPTGDRDHGNSA